MACNCGICQECYWWGCAEHHSEYEDDIEQNSAVIQLNEILTLCRKHGFGENSETAEDAVRQVLQAYLLDHQTLELLNGSR